MNSKQFIKSLSTCYEHYGKKLTPTVGKFWLESLEHGNISLDDAAAALAKHAIDPNVGQYLPKLADVSRHCKPQRLTLTDSEMAELRKKRTADLTKPEQSALGIHWSQGSGYIYPADYEVIE